ncbi:MAG TPA: membrane dipeptidase [Saprospiraceae bacterium]|nr:membrane dipeptidase [Saprospiraceae bacterium]HMQ83885.1 membrane dipeptidase [Saprospiraceae bacterium]
MNAYFDLHVHPSQKSFLSSTRPADRENCWKTYSNSLSIRLRSQASFSQLQQGGVVIAVANVHAIERPMTSSFIMDHVLHLVSSLDKKVMDIPSYSNSFDQILDEIKHLKQSLRTDLMPPDAKPVKIINSLADLDEHSLNLILAVEGGHCLESVDRSLLENFRLLKEKGPRMLYLTLTHFTQFPLTTQAYAFSMLKDNDEFKPKGFGLTPLGKQVIDMAYDDTIGHRTFIDIKHMSVVSRFHFYEYRREKGYQNIPILASHVAVTGISRDPRVITSYFKERAVRRDDFVEVNYHRPRGIGKGLFNKTYFNPWSLNLYDEDVVEVLDSGGLLGINLDQRILGVQEVKGEYFSLKDLNFMLHDYKGTEVEAPFDSGEFTDELVAETRDLDERKHLRHLCNNILHIIKIGGERAWKHLCIGSDFDGLIDPVNNCCDVTEFSKLEAGLISMLPEMMEEDEDHTYDSSNIEGKVRGMMYDNALAFLKEHFR